MPRSTDLPESLKPFARCNAVRLTHERFRADTQGLIKALEQVLSEADAQRRSEEEDARLAAKARATDDHAEAPPDASRADARSPCGLGCCSRRPLFSLMSSLLHATTSSDHAMPRAEQSIAPKVQSHQAKV
jgi:hypothetical protein